MENRDWTRELGGRILVHLARYVECGGPPPINAIMADVEVYGVLMARRGYVSGAIHETSNGTFSYREMLDNVAAPKAFPLPTRTRQVLREEPDPAMGGHLYRYRDGVYEVSSPEDGVWGTCTHWPTPERVALWHSLKHNPYRTEEVPADESNPWPTEAL
jgi:hypothetical protein